MFWKIASFEFRYQLRQPVLWVASVFILLMSFALMSVGDLQIGLGGGVHRNAPFAVAQNTMLLSVFYMFVTTAFVANVVVRDDDTGFGPIVQATPVSRFDYLFGRFTGATLAAVIGFLLVPLGLFVGSLMPWLDPETVGPNAWQTYAVTYLTLGVPNVLFTAALFFALATVTRSMMWTYVGVIGLLMIYTAVNGLLGGKPELETTLSYANPFGLAAFFHATKYWTASERNTLVPALQGILLANRLIVLALGAVFLVLANALFRSASLAAKLGRAQKLKALADTPGAQAASTAPLPKPRFDAATARAQFFARTRFDMGQVFKSPAYFVLLVLGLFLAFVDLLVNRGTWYGTPLYPVTTQNISALDDSFTVIPLIVAVYYAGELVWRERDRKTAEIVDATGAPNWAFAFPKIAAIALVLISTVFVSVAAAIVVQTLKDFPHFQVGEYLIWYVAPLSVTMVLFAVLAVFFQTIAPHKFIGWGLLVIFLIVNKATNQLGFSDLLYHYGSTPDVPLSDMNGQGRFWIGRAWLDLYWSALAVLLVIVSWGLWRRGTETRLWPRLRRLPRAFRGLGGVTATAALLVFAGAGGVIWLNTHVWNVYRTQQDDDRRLAEAEKTLLPFEKKPEPTIVAVTYNVDLHPHERRAVTHGAYVLENDTGAPLQTVYLNANRDLQYLNVSLPAAHLAREYKAFNYRIYRFDTPLAPGARITLAFTTVREQRGFKDRGNTTRLVDNGSFLYSTDLGPTLGYDRADVLKDPAKRRRYGLPSEQRLAKLEDDSARGRNDFGNMPWASTDVTVTTDADQTPIAPGYKVRDVTRDGRRTAEFKSDGRTLAFLCVQSARYAEKHVLYKGVDIGVYYDRQHPYNVDHMIDAAERSLDYYQASFSPYPYRQLRFVEFPDYAEYAEAFPNTVPWSESLGFIADLRNADQNGNFDYVTLVAAHEIGHEWWGLQAVAAQMQGESMLDETLAHYSALMVMKHTLGPDRVRKFLKYELDTYLRSRGGEAIEEVPLERVENQAYIHYRKGAVVMYLLQDQIGEDSVNRALRKYLARYAFQGAPYASSKDLVALFRAEAPADKQDLITDLFEKITLYDLQATQMTARKRPDGRYAVHLVVSANKAYADGRGKETPAKLGEETFDIGLFTAKPGNKTFSSRNVILFQRIPLKGGTQAFDFVTDQAPTFGGVDPYNKYIDRNSDDNVTAATP